jgi:hypothetical protein
LVAFFARGADAREVALVLEREEPAALEAAGFFTVFFAVLVAGFRTEFTLLLRWFIVAHPCELSIGERLAFAQSSCERCSCEEPFERPSLQLACASLRSFVLLAFAWQLSFERPSLQLACASLRSFERPSLRRAFASPLSCELQACEPLSCERLAFAQSSCEPLACGPLSCVRCSFERWFCELQACEPWSFAQSSFERLAFDPWSCELLSSLQLPFEPLA